MPEFHCHCECLKCPPPAPSSNTSFQSLTLISLSQPSRSVLVAVAPDNLKHFPDFGDGFQLCFKFGVRLQHCTPHAIVDPSAAPPTCFRPVAVKFGWRAGLNRRAVENSAGGGANIYRRRRRRESAPLRQHSNKRCRR